MWPYRRAFIVMSFLSLCYFYNIIYHINYHRHHHHNNHNNVGIDLNHINMENHSSVLFAQHKTVSKLKRVRRDLLGSYSLSFPALKHIIGRCKASLEETTREFISGNYYLFFNFTPSPTGTLRVQSA